MRTKFSTCAALAFLASSASKEPGAGAWASWSGAPLASVLPSSAAPFFSSSALRASATYSKVTVTGGSPRHTARMR